MHVDRIKFKVKLQWAVVFVRGSMQLSGLRLAHGLVSARGGSRSMIDRMYSLSLHPGIVDVHVCPILY